MLRIVADENIPGLRELFGHLGPISTLPGREITRSVIAGADVLLVRSVTRVDGPLVEGSPLQFVGSATIGTDHIDQKMLLEHGVHFAHAPGSNAESVVEYVLAALYREAYRQGVELSERTIGIVGHGQIGSRLQPRLEAAGCHVLLNDPPREAVSEQLGAANPYVSLERVLNEADIITCHVPYTQRGPHPTHHLLDAAALRQVKSNAWVVNTSRGAVVDNVAWLDLLERHDEAVALIDVWEQEPTPNLSLVAAAYLATPHIAGYSYDGKINGTVMLFDALMKHLGRDEKGAERARPLLKAKAGDRMLVQPPWNENTDTAWVHRLIEQLYPISDDDRRFRDAMSGDRAEVASAFQQLRKTYPRRRAFSRASISGADLTASQVSLARDLLHLSVIP